MTHLVSAATLVLAAFLQTQPAKTPPQQTAPAAPPAARAPATPPNSSAQPQRSAPRAPAKPQPPMTLRQVIESLSSLKSSSKVEDLISKRGVQFEANPTVLDILKQFGAGPKLLAMIPVPPPPPAPPAPKVAGALTVICEPKDCSVTIDEAPKGTTAQNRKVIDGLHVGETTIQVSAEDFEPVTRKVELQDGEPHEEKFALKRSLTALQQNASSTLLKTIANLGGVAGMSEFGDFEGGGTMQWVDSDGKLQEWSMTFNKRVGNDLSMTFKTRDGQCTATILLQSSKQDCKGGLKTGGDKIADQAATLFLSYQIQDVIQALLQRTVQASETDENRLESADEKDAYILTIGRDGVPVDLVYKIGDSNAPIEVQYSNYINLNRSRYPTKISIGRLNNAPVWTFLLNSVKSRIGR